MITMPACGIDSDYYCKANNATAASHILYCATPQASSNHLNQTAMQQHLDSTSSIFAAWCTHYVVVCMIAYNSIVHACVSSVVHPHHMSPATQLIVLCVSRVASSVHRVKAP
jgi:hypothetical protein